MDANERYSILRMLEDNLGKWNNYPMIPKNCLSFNIFKTFRRIVFVFTKTHIKENKNNC